MDFKKNQPNKKESDLQFKTNYFTSISSPNKSGHLFMKIHFQMLGKDHGEEKVVNKKTNK